MCFVYFDEIILKYLTLSSFFRFEICFVLETFFWTNTGSSCSKIQWISTCILFRFKYLESCKKISENPHEMYFSQIILK